MNRTELIEAVSVDTGLTRAQAEAALDAVVYEVTAGVRGGSPVRITGFGTFKLRERQARRGRNPQTGEAVRIKASKGIGFTPGVKLKADLNSRGALAKPKAAVAAKSVARAAAPVARAAKATKATKATPARKAVTTRKTAAKKVAAPARRTAAKATTARKTTAKKASARR